MSKSKEPTLTKISTSDAGIAELVKQLRDAGIDPNEVLRKELRKASKSPKKTAQKIDKFFCPTVRGHLTHHHQGKAKKG